MNWTYNTSTTTTTAQEQLFIFISKETSGTSNLVLTPSSVNGTHYLKIYGMSRINTNTLTTKDNIGIYASTTRKPIVCPSSICFIRSGITLAGT